MIKIPGLLWVNKCEVFSIHEHLVLFVTNSRFVSGDKNQSNSNFFAHCSEEVENPGANTKEVHSFN